MSAFCCRGVRFLRSISSKETPMRGILSTKRTQWRLFLRRNFICFSVFCAKQISGQTMTRAFTRIFTDHPQSVGETYFERCCQTNEPKHQYLVDGYFYGVTKERHSVRAASRFSLNVLRFESDLCELNKLRNEAWIEANFCRL